MGAAAAAVTRAPQGTAGGFTFSIPPGFNQRGGWFVASHIENRGSGDEIACALV